MRFLRKYFELKEREVTALEKIEGVLARRAGTVDNILIKMTQKENVPVTTDNSVVGHLVGTGIHGGKQDDCSICNPPVVFKDEVCGHITFEEDCESCAANESNADPRPSKFYDPGPGNFLYPLCDEVLEKMGLRAVALGTWKVDHDAYQFLLIKRMSKWKIIKRVVVTCVPQPDTTLFDGEILNDNHLMGIFRQWGIKLKKAENVTSVGPLGPHGHPEGPPGPEQPYEIYQHNNSVGDPLREVFNKLGFEECFAGGLGSDGWTMWLCGKAEQKISKKYWVFPVEGRKGWYAIYTGLGAPSNMVRNGIIESETHLKEIFKTKWGVEL